MPPPQATRLVRTLGRQLSGVAKAIPIPLLRKQTEDGPGGASLRSSLSAIANSISKLCFLWQYRLQAKVLGHAQNCIEGQYNKVFILTMDNGIEVVAKLPNPNAGPAFYTTASEVATRQFLREVPHIPVPKIYAWSPDSSNPVGAEYIIEEKCVGQPLGSVWYQWPQESQVQMVQQIIDMEVKLMSILFLKHGSIYYKADLDSRRHTSEPLSVDMSESSMKIDRSALDKFAIGPVTEAKLWGGRRASMNLDRGPWRTSLDYMKAMGANELCWAESHSHPRMNYHRSDQAKSISHPDLHLDNIFIDPETKQITHIIDWQSASISDVFLQRKVPQILGPLNHTTSGDIAEKVPQSQQTNTMAQYYEQLVKKRIPRRSAILDEEHLSIRMKPVSLVCGSWQREDVFSFRHSLVGIAAHWSSLVGENKTPCPFDLSAEEYARRNSEMELLEGLSTFMHQLHDQNLIPLADMIRREYFDGVQKVNDRCKQWFVDLGDTDHQRQLHAKVWPYLE